MVAVDYAPSDSRNSFGLRICQFDQRLGKTSRNVCPNGSGILKLRKGERYITAARHKLGFVSVSGKTAGYLLLRLLSSVSLVNRADVDQSFTTCLHCVFVLSRWSRTSTQHLL